MSDILSVNNTIFTIWGYDMSFLEFFGTLLNIACVWLVARNKILNWPVGLVAVLLFGLLFYQFQLYSDFIEQIFYFATGIWGWMLWSKQAKRPEKQKKLISRNNFKDNVWTGLAIVVGTIALGAFISHIHTLLPQWFSEPAAFPYLDAFTTVMSFTAQILLVLRRLENWHIWIAVDVIGVGLYYARGVKMVAVLYFIFLILASRGLINWKKEYDGYGKAAEEISVEAEAKEEAI